MPTRRRLGVSAAAAFATLAAVLVCAAPAEALGSGSYSCGNGSYTAASTTSNASSKSKGYSCGSYHARAHYSYNGVSYWTSFVTSASNAVAMAPYQTVEYGEHYTDKSSTVRK